MPWWPTRCASWPCRRARGRRTWPPSPAPSRSGSTAPRRPWRPAPRHVDEIERVAHAVEGALTTIVASAERTRVAADRVTGLAEGNAAAAVDAAHDIAAVADTAVVHAESGGGRARGHRAAGKRLPHGRRGHRAPDAAAPASCAAWWASCAWPRGKRAAADWSDGRSAASAVPAFFVPRPGGGRRARGQAPPPPHGRADVAARSCAGPRTSFRRRDRREHGIQRNEGGRRERHVASLRPRFRSDHPDSCARFGDPGRPAPGRPAGSACRPRKTAISPAAYRYR